MFATSRGFRIRYQVWGSGPALVLLHGLAMWGDRWRDTGYVSALETRFRLVVPDHLGHGQSDMPHEPAAYGLSNLATDVIAVLDAAGVGRAHVWGYSMGARVAENLAVKAPDRVLSLTLGGAAPGLDQEQWRELLPPTVPASWDELFGGLPQAVIDMFKEHNKDFAAIQACVAASSQEATTIRDLQAAPHPTLAYAGADDLPDLVRRQCEALPCQFEIVPGGHAEAFRQSDNILPLVISHIEASAAAPA
jgi:pimeloyl-ACP methyl ester carboxylesterase